MGLLVCKNMDSSRKKALGWKNCVKPAVDHDMMSPWIRVTLHGLSISAGSFSFLSLRLARRGN